MKLMFLLLLIFFILYECHKNVVETANILTIAGVASKSHFLWHRILVKELVNRGHNVTILTPNFDKSSENYTIIQMEGVNEKLQHFLNTNLQDLLQENSFTMLRVDWIYLYTTCDYELSSNGMKKIIEYPKNFFDLVIIDVAGGPECHFPLIKKLGSPPVVATSPFTLAPYMNSYTGDWIYPSIVPLYSVPYTDKMSFFERFHNFLATMFLLIYRDYINIDQFVQRTRDFYGPDAENSFDVGQNINILLANVDPILSFPRPYVPNIIPVGGLHIHLQGLPTNVKEFLDNSTEGVILFAMGSNFQSNTMPPEKQQILLQAFKQLPYKVLWKWESDSMKNKPDNVMIQKWLPQCDVLNHPNIKLFITHGGELSIQEAIYYHKPIVGIPIFLDQHTNLKRMAHKGFGVILDFQTLTSEKLIQAINKVITNSTYRQSMERFSRLYRDQPHTAMERAMFWIEYVLRHKHIPELQVASIKMPFYQKYCLDIIGTLLLGAYITTKIITIVLKFTYIVLFRRKQVKEKIN